VLQRHGPLIQREHESIGDAEQSPINRSKRRALAMLQEFEMQ
jgi:hypothetical protein